MKTQTKGLKNIAQDLAFTKDSGEYVDVTDLLNHYKIEKRIVARICDCDSYFTQGFKAEDLLHIGYNAKWDMWRVKFTNKPWIYMSSHIIENVYAIEAFELETKNK